MSTAGTPGSRAATHACPGCGAPGLSRERFACRPSHLVAHHHAMRDAEDWYAGHPAGTAR